MFRTRVDAALKGFVSNTVVSAGCLDATSRDERLGSLGDAVGDVLDVETDLAVLRGWDGRARSGILVTWKNCQCRPSVKVFMTVVLFLRFGQKGEIFTIWNTHVKTQRAAPCPVTCAQAIALCIVLLVLASTMDVKLFPMCSTSVGS
jgi:hypothetical protein